MTMMGEGGADDVGTVENRYHLENALEDSADDLHHSFASQNDLRELSKTLLTNQLSDN